MRDRLAMTLGDDPGKRSTIRITVRSVPVTETIRKVYSIGVPATDN
jgi:hypothetical protein